MSHIKNNRKKILWITGIIIFPFALEKILFATPVVSKYNNEVWFSFMGSYVGAVVTLWVMYNTFKKSDEENKELIKRQKRQHEIDIQNEKLLGIIHILLLDDYHFLNPDTVLENIEKFTKDLRYVQFDTLKFRYITQKDEILVDELLKLQMEEVEILNSMRNAPHVDSSKKAEEFKMFMLDDGLRLSTVAESRKDTIMAMYENYLEKVYKEYYD